MKTLLLIAALIAGGYLAYLTIQATPENSVSAQALDAETIADQHESVGQQASVQSAPVSLVADSNTNQVQSNPNTTVTLQALTGNTILFKTQNGQFSNDTAPKKKVIPYLVLYRNAQLTAPQERSINISLNGIEIPPQGLTVKLTVETQHGDPDQGGDESHRIIVWQDERWIDGNTQTGSPIIFTPQFIESTLTVNGSIPTPTDYYRYQLTVKDANNTLTHSFEEDYAFLMESQWVAPLPEVNEDAPGAAPDELVVYYLDMFPFQRSVADNGTRLAKAQIHQFVQTELVPGMVEAFRTQSQDWGLTWHQAWSSYRPNEPENRLSVALTKRWTWFHGSAPVMGYAGISINVEGGASAEYDTLRDGIISTFHHELFHNHQRGLNLALGGNGVVDGKDGSWQVFTEGMAVFVSSVGMSAVEFAPNAAERAYLSRANKFLASQGGLGGELNGSYHNMVPYRASIYWRFLYEQCGGMKDGKENPTAGLQVIQNTLSVLYAGQVVNIQATGNVVSHLPTIMDRALENSNCPFSTYKDSLIAFANAVYALTLTGNTSGSALFDPNQQYAQPPVSEISYNGETTSINTIAQPQPTGIPSSFGMDFVELVLSPELNGQQLTIEFYDNPAAASEFNVQILLLKGIQASGKSKRINPQTISLAEAASSNGDESLVYTIPGIETSEYDRIGLIINRLDNQESADPIGAYNIVIRP
jgi:hypothetical protein